MAEFSSLQTNALCVRQLLTFSLVGGASLLPPHSTPQGHGPHAVCMSSQEQGTLLPTATSSSDVVPFSCCCGLSGGVFRSHGDLG